MKNFLVCLFCGVVTLAVAFIEPPKVTAQTHGNSYVPVPMQVMEVGKLTNYAINTALITHMGTTNSLSNNFAGFLRTNCTWILYSNSVNNTGSMIVTAIRESEKKYGYYMPTVTQPDPNQQTWLSQHPRGSNDVCVQATFKAGLRPSVLIIGFTLSISNWSSEQPTITTGKGFDLMRIGQSPYIICQFGDGSQLSGKSTLQSHSPDGAGVGGSIIVIDNGEIYECMLLYDAHEDRGAIRIYQKLPNGRYQYKGESWIPMTSSTAAENVFIGVSDDHSGWDFSTSVGGDFRLSNIWASTNRADFYSHGFLRY